MKLLRKERIDYDSAFVRDEDSRYTWRKQRSESFLDFELPWENTRRIGYGIQRNLLKIGLWLVQFAESKNDKYIGKSNE